MKPPNKEIKWFSLSRILLLKFLVAVILLALAISFMFFEISKRQLINSSERYAISIATNLQDEIYQHFFIPQSITLDSFDWTNQTQLAALDSISSRFLNHLNVLKVNIFSNERQLVYSTNHKLLGVFTKENKKLIHALQGEYVSSLELSRDKPDVEHDKHSVDLLETYIPFRQFHTGSSDKEQIFGSFEIYQDVTILYHQIVDLRNIIFVSSFVLMGFFFIILYLIIKRADKLQRNLEFSVQRHTEQLEEEVDNRTSELTDKTNRLQAILDNVPSAFILLDRNFQIKASSAALGKLSNYHSEETIGKYCYTVFGEGNFCHNCPSRRAAESGEISSVVKEKKLDNSKIQYLEHTSIPIKENGSITSILEIVTDITERKRIEKLALRAEKLSATGEMSAVIAHEIRNSLTSLKLIMQFLEESTRIPEKETNSIKIAMESVYEMEGIVTDLLNFARPRAPKFVMKNVNQILQESNSLVRYQIEQRQIQLDEKLSPGIPECSVDPDHLKAAFVNILLNSIDAISENGKIIVSANLVTLSEPVLDFFSEQQINVKLDEGQTVIQITFEDNGSGIPDVHIDHIFDPFFTTKISGTGLGLPMTKRVINEHEGVISVESNDGNGSIFKIFIPYRA
jgi:two-component system sensor histidine kinase AtoS